MNDEKCKIDGEWCRGDCPYLKPYGDEWDLTARCEKLGVELTWHDFWLAQCLPDPRDVKP